MQEKEEVLLIFYQPVEQGLLFLQQKGPKSECSNGGTFQFDCGNFEKMGRKVPLRWQVIHNSRDFHLPWQIKA